MKVNPMIVLREDFDNIAVLFNPNNGAIFQLNQTALFIWKEIEKGADLPAIIQGLHQACGDTFSESAHAEVENFIDKMKKSGYILDE